MIAHFDLLEELRYTVGCEYISDLKEECMLQKVKTAIKSIDTQRFSVEEWNRAVQYLTGALTIFNEAETAIDFLINKFN